MEELTYKDLSKTELDTLKDIYIYQVELTLCLRVI